MLTTPHFLVEGAIIAAYAIRARHAFIYLRGEVVPVLRRLRAAVAEAYEAGYLGENILGSGYDLDLIVHAGAVGAYICGEETALLDSLEGRRGQPPLRPPFPAVAGLYACPTVVNNVESIASVPPIMVKGLDWFKSMGTEKSPGFTLYSLSGHVTRPGQYEAPLGITLRELLDYAGGVRAGHELKFLTPGGLIDAAADTRTPRRTTGLRGHGLRWTRCWAPRHCRSLTRPPAWCARCGAGCSSTPTSPAASAPRAGGHLLAGADLRAAGDRRRGQKDDLDKLTDIADAILGKSFCALGDGAASPIMSSLKYFRTEYETHPFRRLPVRPERLDPLCASRRRGALMTVSPDDDLVTITIDDTTLSVPKGTLVIRAAEMIGDQIPRFCDHPLLEPVGACRQCLGRGRGPAQAAGQLHHHGHRRHGVRSQNTSESADKAQRGVMELLLINHPLDCPVCDKGGECPLQNQAMSSGRAETRFTDVKRTFPSRSTCPPRCCWTASAACCAHAAPGSPSRSPATRSSN